MVRTYEVYPRVEKIFHKRAQQTSEIFFSQEDKLHMFKPTCNFFYYIDMSVSKITLILQGPNQRNDVSDIFTSENMENTSLVSRM